MENLTEEQRERIRGVLSLASSDSNSASRAYDALISILTSPSPSPSPSPSLLEVTHKETTHTEEEVRESSK